MLESLRKNDVAYLGQLRDYFAAHGTLPSLAGISEIIGFRAKNSAVKLAGRLQTAGFLQRAPGGKLAPTSEFFGLPLMATSVRAGSPEQIEAEEVAERVSLDQMLVDNPSATVMINVTGDSMSDAGIFDGDVAIVERASTASSGELVVAIVDGEFTLKELFLKGGQVKLLPRNSAYKPIVPRQRLELFGVVRGIVRKYRPAKGTRKR